MPSPAGERAGVRGRSQDAQRPRRRPRSPTGSDFVLILFLTPACASHAATARVTLQALSRSASASLAGAQPLRTSSRDPSAEVAPVSRCVRSARFSKTRATLTVMNDTRDLTKRLAELLRREQGALADFLRFSGVMTFASSTTLVMHSRPSARSCRASSTPRSGRPRRSRRSCGPRGLRRTGTSSRSRSRQHRPRL